MPNCQDARQDTTMSERSYYETASNTWRNKECGRKRHAPPDAQTCDTTEQAHTDIETVIIEQLNAGELDRQRIAEATETDVASVQETLARLPVSDPRLADFRKHLKRPPDPRPPEVEQWKPQWTDADILFLYDKGEAIADIATDAQTSTEHIRSVVEAQPF